MSRLAMFALALAACTGNNPGAGTGTLRIEGSVRGSSNGDGTTYTGMTVTVSKDGQPVLDATVTVTGVSGRHVLGKDIRFPGRFSIIAEHYDEIYAFEVEAGADNLRGVRVDGPTIPELTSPAESSTIDPTAPLEIRWKASPSDSTALLINPQGKGITVEDTGSFTIPANTLISNAAGSHAIGLVRFNTLVPEGAAEGSTISVGADAFLHVCDRPGTGLCTP